MFWLLGQNPTNMSLWLNANHTASEVPLHFQFMKSEKVDCSGQQVIQLKVLSAAIYTTWALLSAVYAMALCLSVCQTATSRSSTKMAKHRNTRTMPPSNSDTPVFWCQRSLWNSNGVTPNGINWPLTLNFCVWVGHDHSSQEIEGQGHRSWVRLMSVWPWSMAFFLVTAAAVKLILICAVLLSLV